MLDQSYDGCIADMCCSTSKATHHKIIVVEEDIMKTREDENMRTGHYLKEPVPKTWPSI